tara:strand:+ start:1030 stop:1287 length:258 start_codon:yes stop_codon:yes gene_type:complete
MNVSIQLLTRKDCCLCDEAKAVLKKVLPEFSSTSLTLTDIDSDPALVRKYGKKIPVIILNGKESFFYKVHPLTLRKKIEKILSSN